MAGKKTAGVVDSSTTASLVTLALGALVALKAQPDGPQMTVEMIEGDQVTTTWKVGDEDRSDVFLASDLVFVTPVDEAAAAAAKAKADQDAADAKAKAETDAAAAKAIEDKAAEDKAETDKAAAAKAAPKSEFPLRMKLVSDASVALSFPEVKAFVPALGESEPFTVQSPDQLARLKTDVEQLLYRHGIPLNAVTPELVPE